MVLTAAVAPPGRLGAVGAVAPGLVAVAGLTGLAWAVAGLFPALSTLVVAVAVGAVIANTVGVPARLQPGLAFAGRRLLRAGVVLLGLRLSIGDVGALGVDGVAVVATTVAATFSGVQWLGRRMGLGRDLSLLVATGYSICGASAIAAVDGTTRADEEEVAAAIGLVTLFGTASIVTLPLVGGWVGFDDATFGAWVGAATHDVAQVVAAASTAGPTAVSAAVVVKLTRVALLAPLVTGVSLQRRRTSAAHPVGGRPPLLPLFVVGFLAAVAVRSTGSVSADALSWAQTAEGLVLAAAMVGLGTGVRLDRLRRLGPRPLLLGVAAWIIVAGVSLLGVLTVTG